MDVWQYLKWAENAFEAFKGLLHMLWKILFGSKNQRKKYLRVISTNSGENE